MLTLWDTALAPNVRATLFERMTWPAKRLPAQPVVGSPTRMGTVALVTLSAVAGEGPDTSVPQILRKLALLAVTPRVIWEPTIVKAPPGWTVTGPATRAPEINRL